VVIPLTTQVSAARWRDVWRRARAALCPEADPACKDPSRAYWLPSHGGGVTAKTTCHDGPLLDPGTLPELPADDFPTPATVDGTIRIEIDGAVLKTAIDQVVFAAAPDDTRPVLAGVLVRLEAGILTLENWTPTQY
jgi:hypothetical protein